MYGDRIADVRRNRGGTVGSRGRTYRSHHVLPIERLDPCPVFLDSRPNAVRSVSPVDCRRSQRSGHPVFSSDRNGEFPSRSGGYGIMGVVFLHVEIDHAPDGRLVSVVTMLVRSQIVLRHDRFGTVDELVPFRSEQSIARRGGEAVPGVRPSDDEKRRDEGGNGPRGAPHPGFRFRIHGF